MYNDIISYIYFVISYRNIKEEQWKHGPNLGLILKGYDPLNNLEKSSKTDGFLNFTLTRAFKSSFQGPKSNKDNMPLHMVIYIHVYFIIINLFHS